MELVCFFISKKYLIQKYAPCLYFDKTIYTKYTREYCAFKVSDKKRELVICYPITVFARGHESPPVFVGVYLIHQSVM